jgi:hypothetical protein
MLAESVVLPTADETPGVVVVFVPPLVSGAQFAPQ